MSRVPALRPSSFDEACCSKFFNWRPTDQTGRGLMHFQLCHLPIQRLKMHNVCFLRERRNSKRWWRRHARRTREIKKRLKKSQPWVGFSKIFERLNPFASRKNKSQFRNSPRWNETSPSPNTRRKFGKEWQHKSTRRTGQGEEMFPDPCRLLCMGSNPTTGG